MGDIGEISVYKISNKYNLGIEYAKNTINKLEEIGYIKKKNEHIYEIIQTEYEIDSYIKLHLEEFKPKHYKELGIKNNGDLSFKSKMQMNIGYYKVVAPVFVRRILFSIPQIFILLLLIPIYRSMDLIDDKAGIAYKTLFYIFLTGTSYIFIGIPINILIRFFQSGIYKMKFKDFMLLPRNWFFTRCKHTYEIQKILYDNKVKFSIGNYDSIMKQLDNILNKKKALAEHYANIANNAENENEFYQSINSCISTLEWMIQFERFGVFSAGQAPSDDIKMIKDSMDISVKRFQKRMDDMQKKVFCDYDNMEGHQFEFFFADILKNNQFLNVEVTRGSGDHGIDILAEKDGITYAVQCKRYDKPVGNDAVQQAYTGKGFYQKDIAVVITNRYFTPQAIEEANVLGVKLWDRNKLNEMIEYGNK